MSPIGRYTIALLLYVLAAGASAQYIWLNEKGRKQFSDTPPPASVPKHRILKDTPDLPTVQVVSQSDSVFNSEKVNADKGASASAAAVSASATGKDASASAKDGTTKEEAPPAKTAR